MTRGGVQQPDARAAAAYASGVPLVLPGHWGPDGRWVPMPSSGSTASAAELFLSELSIVDKHDLQVGAKIDAQNGLRSSRFEVQ